MYGTDKIKNSFHGSQTLESALAEIQAFFPSYLNRGFSSRASIINNEGGLARSVKVSMARIGSRELLSTSMRNSIVNVRASKSDLAPPQDLERTLALIKPDAYPGKKDDIMYTIQNSGFKVVLEREVKLTKEMAQEFYKEHEGKGFYEELTTWMSRCVILNC